MRRFLFVLTFTLAALAGPEAQSAETPAAASGAAGLPAAPLPLPPELEAELAALREVRWNFSGNARAEIGWRDNILLSPFGEIARAFGRGELEGMLLRPMRNDWEIVSFLNGDVLRYFSPPAESAGEQQWSLHAEVRWQPVKPVRLGLKATGYLRDMVVDLSETESQRVVVPTRVRGGYVTAAPRFSLPAGFRFEPYVQVRRSDFRDYPGDYDEGRGGGRLEWRRSGWVVAATGFESRRRYDERQQFTAGGRALVGTHLRFYQRDGEFKVQKEWTAAGDWTVAASAGRLENRDRASGYFDYDQNRGRFEVTWERDAWKATLDGVAKRSEYRVQTVGTGIMPPPRISEDFEVAGRLERAVRANWKAFAEYRWERSRSNEFEFRYRLNTVLAGVQRDF